MPASEPAGWQEAKRIFAEAIEQPAAKRAEYLDRACAGNAALRQEIESLLENRTVTGGFFEEPAVQPLRVNSIGVSLGSSLVGRRIGAYRVLRAIGQGGMGTVYLAERADGEFRRRVALKTVKPEFLTEQTLRRFDNERRTLAVLDHPNIIKLLDGGATEDGLPYLVTDYVEGQTIDVFCATRKLPARERLRLFREVLSAVHYAHQNLVVHRDLKPSNILVTAEGAVKLLDFGIAKLVRPEYLGGAMGLTRTSAQPLTPEFASPEQVLGQPVTTASDIYSLGVILYLLLAGKHPFERKTNTLAELERAICETEPERPSTVALGTTKPEAAAARLLRGDPDNIVLMAMRKEPQRRYASAEHFSEDIRRYLDGWPVLARRPSAWYRASKFIGRHKTGVAAAALFTVSLAASATWAFQEMRLAQRQMRLAQTRFSDLHDFAKFAIFLDDKLRMDLLTARQELNGKALGYLDGLAKEAGSDTSLRRELSEGYIHAGDVAGNPNYSSNLGNMQAAEENYRKALAIAPDSAARTKARMKLEDVLWPRGQWDQALEVYRAAARDAEATLAAKPGDKDALTTGFRAWDKMMSVNENRGDIAAAVDSGRQCLKYAEALRNPSLLAYLRERQGAFLVLQGKATEGEQEIRQAMAAYEVLGHASAAAGPRRNLAKANKSLGDAQRANGKWDEAEQSYRRSLGDLMKLAGKDTRSASYQIDIGNAYAALIELLLARGKTAEAKLETANALEVLRPFAENPDADESRMYYCAWLLATTPFPELRNDGLAMKLALRMDAADPNDPEVMDVLARVKARAGEKAAALALEEKARGGFARPAVRAHIEAEISELRGGAKPE